MEILELKLASIEVGTDRARPLDPVVVEALAASIREQGLLQPIVVRKVDDAYHLVAGWHRLEAVRGLGLSDIRVQVLPIGSADDAKLAEVMENLGRGELIALDRCHHLYDLKQVWERLYPEVAHGKASPKIRNPDLSSDAPEVFGFVRACAEKIGLGRSQISEAVKVWTGLSDASRTDLCGTKLTTKMTELKALSELPAKSSPRFWTRSSIPNCPMSAMSPKHWIIWPKALPQTQLKSGSSLQAAISALLMMRHSIMCLPRTKSG